jgi:hypothetical protein
MCLKRCEVLYICCLQNLFCMLKLDNFVGMIAWDYQQLKPSRDKKNNFLLLRSKLLAEN